MHTQTTIETKTHRLILPRDSNHHGTFYAGSLLSLSLEAAYAAAYQSIGQGANLVLRRVLDLRCYQPVPVGHVVEIRARLVFEARAQVIIGLHGSPLTGKSGPWMDGLMQFAQVDAEGRPVAITREVGDAGIATDEPIGPPWDDLVARLAKLRSLRA